MAAVTFTEPKGAGATASTLVTLALFFALSRYTQCIPYGMYLQKHRPGCLDVEDRGCRIMARDCRLE